MVLPKYNELMKPLLFVINDGEVHAFKEVIATLAHKLNLSEEDLKEKLPSGNQSVFKNRVGWAKTYLKKAGLVDTQHVRVLLLQMLERKLLKKIQKLLIQNI